MASGHGLPDPSLGHPAPWALMFSHQPMPDEYEIIAAPGYVVVDPSHRGRGIGAALVPAVVERFCGERYRHLWLGVQGWRLPAIRIYLRAGYRPFLHPPDAEELAGAMAAHPHTAGLVDDR